MKLRKLSPGLSAVNPSLRLLAKLFLFSAIAAWVCGCGFTRAQVGQNGNVAPAQAVAASAVATATAPAAFHHTVKRGESIPAVVRQYISHTSYMTGAELESALREANHKPKGNGLKPGEDLIIPGYESEPIVEHPVPVAKDFEVRAIYLTGTMAGSDHGIRIVRRWHELGGNAVVFDIKDSDGSVNIAFDHPLAPKARHHSIANLPKFIRFLHEQKMHAIARIALFRDEHIARDYPELAVQSKRALLGAPAQSRAQQAEVAENNPAKMQSAPDDKLTQDKAAPNQNPVVANTPSPEQAVQENKAAQNEIAQNKSAQSKRAPLPWRENGKLVWTDPSNTKVQDYDLALAKYVAGSGADEIQFDYVRFPAEGDQKDAQFAFMKSHPEWQRADVIAGFLSRAYSELHPAGVLLSLDVFGVMAWQRSVDLNHTGQDIVRMAKFCDVLSPMIYPSHFFGMDGYRRPGDAPEHFISVSMQRFEKITQGSGVVLRPWLQAFAWRTPTYSPQYIETQVKVAKNNGGVGFLFWNARNDYGRPFAAMPDMTHKMDQYFQTVAAKKS